MIIELMRISVPHQHKQEFSKALASLVSPLQLQPGCLSSQLSQAWPNQNGLYVEARWENEEYLVHYLRSQAYKRLLLLIELSAGPPVVEFFKVLQIRGLDLVQQVRSPADEPQQDPTGPGC
jgi:quinol monooxygenase YgiN